jgi:hypothetical protein
VAISTAGIKVAISGGEDHRLRARRRGVDEMRADCNVDAPLAIGSLLILIHGVQVYIHSFRFHRGVERA